MFGTKLTASSPMSRNTILWGKMKKETAPCSSCARKTLHDVLFERKREDKYSRSTYYLLSCCGCDAVSMCEMGSSDTVPFFRRYYPSPVWRKEPDWVLAMRSNGSAEEQLISGLLHEIYQAVRGEQFRLAAMGIRALLEHVMIAKVGDLNSFEKNLDAFQNAGYISHIQRDAMKATLLIEVGHAAVHRAFSPTYANLIVALDVVEGVLAPLFAHKDAAEKLAQRVPPRVPRR